MSEFISYSIHEFIWGLISVVWLYITYTQTAILLSKLLYILEPPLGKEHLPSYPSTMSATISTILPSQYYQVGGVKKESFVSLYTVEVTSTESESQSESESESDWSDADDDECDQSAFFKPAVIPVPYFRPLYVPSKSYKEHKKAMRFSPYHRR